MWSTISFLGAICHFLCLFHENLLFLLETTLINKMHSKCIVSDGPLFLDDFSFLCFS